MVSSKRNLVFIHGFLSGREYWHKQQLLQQYAELFFVELPGYGNLAGEESCESIEAFAKAAVEQIDQNNIDHFDLIGHSMGGMIAQEVVKLAGDRVDKLILFGTGAIGDIPSRFEPIETSLAKASAESFDKDVRKAVASWFLEYEGSDDFSAALALASKASFGTYYQGLNAMKNWCNVENLAAIKQETLLLWGDKDRTYNLEQQRILLGNIPNVHFAAIPNSAHNTHLEKPSLLNAMIVDFLY